MSETDGDIEMRQVNEQYDSHWPLDHHHIGGYIYI